MTNLSQQLTKARRNYKLASSKGLEKKALYWKTYESELSAREKSITYGEMDLSEAIKLSAATAKNVVETGGQSTEYVPSPIHENYKDINEGLFGDVRDKVSGAWSAAGRKVRNIGRNLRYRTQVSLRSIKRWFASLHRVDEKIRVDMAFEAVDIVINSGQAFARVANNEDPTLTDVTIDAWEYQKLVNKAYKELLSQYIDSYLAQWDRENPEIEEPQYESWVRNTFNKVTSGIGKFARNKAKLIGYKIKKSIADIRYYIMAKYVVNQSKLDKIREDIMNSRDYKNGLQQAQAAVNDGRENAYRRFLAKWANIITQAETDYIISMLGTNPRVPQYESDDIGLLTESIFDYVIDASTNTESRQLDMAARRLVAMNEEERQLICETAAGMYGFRLSNEDADINETLALISAEVVGHVVGIPSPMFEAQFDKMIMDPNARPQSTTVQVEESDAVSDDIHGKTTGASASKEVVKRLDELWDIADEMCAQNMKPYLESIIQSVVKGSRLVRNSSITFTDLMEQALKSAEPLRDAAMLEAVEIGVEAEDIVKTAPKTEGTKIKDKGLIDKHDKSSADAITATGKKKEGVAPGALLDPEMKPPGEGGNVNEGVKSLIKRATRGSVNTIRGKMAANTDLSVNRISKEDKKNRQNYVAELIKKQEEKKRKSKASKDADRVRMEHQYGGALSAYAQEFVGGKLTKEQFTSKLSEKRAQLKKKYGGINESLSPLEQLVLQAEGRKLEKEKIEIAAKYPFFESLDDSGKEKFMNMSEAEKTGVSGEIMSSYWNMNPVKMEKILESADQKYGAYAFISTIPDRLVPIWEALDVEARNGIAGLYRLQNIQSVYESSIFWETTLSTDLIGNKSKQIGNQIVNLNEDLDIKGATPTYKGVSHLGYSADFVDSIF